MSSASQQQRAIRASAAPEENRLYTIGELAAEFDVTTRAIRFYEAKGLIAPARRGVARAYSRRDRTRLRLILRGKNLGFSLEAIAEYLKLYDADPAHVAQTQMLLAGVERAIENLQVKRADLDRTLKELKDIRGQCVEHLKAQGAAASMPSAARAVAAQGGTSMGADWEPMSSRTIAAIRHNPGDRTLDVRLRTGRAYRYFKVDEAVADDFRQAPSKGRFFNASIKDAYAFERIA